MEIEMVDPVAAAEDDVVAVHRVAAAYRRELVPEDPLPPVERFVTRVRTPWAYSEDRWWIAREGGQVVGYSELTLSRNRPENRDQAWCSVTVDPERRGTGVARALLTPLCDDAAADERTTLCFGTGRDHPSVGFCRRLAGEHRYMERISRLRLDQLDRALLEGWVARAGDRAGDYELGGFDGPCPEEHLEEFARARDVMNTAPREDYEEEDEHHTPDQVRQADAWFSAVGVTPWVRWARHRETGEIAGYTSVFHDRWKAWELDQGDTGVWPRHRERGLGRWLKADMLLRILDECPEARWIDTDNAGSNQPMLAINDALGFRPVLWWQAWQAPIDGVRAAL